MYSYTRPTGTDPILGSTEIDTVSYPNGMDKVITSGTTEKHRFTNYERDSESSTDYAINRQYSSSTGRFLRPDPVTGTVLDPQTLNRYGYVGNDSVGRTDPDGRHPRDQHQYITFMMAILLGYGNASANRIGQGAGDADNFRNAATGLLGLGVFELRQAFWGSVKDHFLGTKRLPVWICGSNCRSQSG